MKRHDPPFECRICVTNGSRIRPRFGTKYDLERHCQSVHNDHSKYYCPESTCEQREGGSKGGFNRKDNLLTHLRSHHPQMANDKLDHPTKGCRNSSSLKEQELQNPEISTRRNNDESTRRKRQRSENSDTDSDVVYNVLTNRDLRLENKRLRNTVATQEAEIQKLKDNMEKLERYHDKETERLLKTIVDLGSRRNQEV
jgi:hypothetical protein